MVSFLNNSPDPCVPWSGKDKVQISGKNFRESEIGAGTLRMTSSLYGQIDKEGECALGRKSRGYAEAPECDRTVWAQGNGQFSGIKVHTYVWSVAATNDTIETCKEHWLYH